MKSLSNNIEAEKVIKKGDVLLALRQEISTGYYIYKVRFPHRYFRCLLFPVNVGNANVNVTLTRLPFVHGDAP